MARGSNSPSRDIVTCTRVDPAILRSGRGLAKAMKEAGNSRIEQGVFEQRAEDTRVAAQEAKAQRAEDKKQQRIQAAA